MQNTLATCGNYLGFPAILVKLNEIFEERIDNCNEFIEEGNNNRIGDCSEISSIFCKKSGKFTELLHSRNTVDNCNFLGLERCNIVLILH